MGNKFICLEDLGSKYINNLLDIYLRLSKVYKAAYMPVKFIFNLRKILNSGHELMSFTLFYLILVAYDINTTGIT